MKEKNKCKTKRCCIETRRDGKLISTKCKNVKKFCKTITTRRCKKKKTSSGCGYK